MVGVIPPCLDNSGRYNALMVQFECRQKKYFVAILLCFVAVISISCQQSIENSITSLATPFTQSSSQLTPSAESLARGPSLPQRYLNNTGQPAFVTVKVVSASEEHVGLQMPAFIEAEIAGRSMKNVVLLAGRQEEDGSRRLLLYDELKPALLTGEAETWPDGIHEIVQIWYSVGDYLADEASGDFVLLRESNLGEVFHTVDGRFRPATQDEYIDAVLILDIGAGGSTGLIDSTTGAVINPQPGDEFQITNIHLLEDLILSHSPGESLIFNQAGRLMYEKRPLPGEVYFLGISSETASGLTATDLRELTVGNENLRPGLHAYYDPEKNFQFLYPEYLMEITEEGETLTTQNISGTVKLTITNYPESYQKPVAELKSDVLRTFGDVQILYEDTAPVGSTGALWTAYGYDAADGSHTGVFLVLYQGEMAYVVDVESRSDEEERMLETVKILSESWVTRPGVFGQFSGDWQPASVNDLELWVPSDYQYAKLTNEWHRFSGADGLTFVALRSEPAAGGRILDRMRHWLEISARDVDDFAYSDFYTLDLADNSWIRLDFIYKLNDGTEMAGSIMATRFDEELLYAWAEAPAEIYDTFEQEQYLLLLTNVRQVGG